MNKPLTIDLSEAAERAIRMVRESKNLSYDTETSGLDWKINSPVGYVIGAPKGEHLAPDDVVYIPVRHGGGGNLQGGIAMRTPEDEITIHPFEEELARAFASRKDNELAQRGRIVGHHIKFDAHFSANAGIYLGRRMADTQDTEAMLDEYAGSFSLENSAARRGVTAKKGDEMYKHLSRLFDVAPTKDSMAHFWRTAGNDPMVQEYARGDGVTTWELFVKQRHLIHEDDMDYIWELESDLIWTVFRMERKGIRVDLSRAAALRSATEARITEALRAFPAGFNPRSPVMMKKVMDEGGFTDYPKTAKGNPSFTETWLKKNPLGKKVIEIRQMTNLLNSFVGPLETKHVHKGRVHATLHQLKNDEKGTISGRFSCSNPNLQQVPKRNKELAIPFRQLFVPDEGYVFWERDYSQCEPRLFAHYAQDPNLLSGYNATPFVDAHSTVAKLLDVERDPTAKRMNMGIFTGMQPNTFAGHMGWDVEKATHAHKAWFDAFPAIRSFQNKAKARLKNRGYVFTILGRRCRLEEPRFAYRGTSKIIQGSNADILKYKLLQADRFCEDNGDKVQILMTVHDSFNGQYEDTPEARALFEQMCDMLEDVQTDPINLSVPFVVEGDEGPDWAIATYGEQ